MYDNIAKLYINMVEAFDHGSTSFSPIRHQSFRETLYNNDVEKIGDISNTLSLHKVSGGDDSEIFIVKDHSKKEAVYASNFRRNIHPELKFDHIVQDEVTKVKGSGIPPEFVSDHAIGQAKLHNLPLVSSADQYHPGHALWNRMLDKAALPNSGLHIYSSDNGKLTKHNRDTYKLASENYFFKSDAHRTKHMIISPKELEI